MKPSLYIVTAFFVWFAASLQSQLVKPDATVRIDTEAACDRFSKYVSHKIQGDRVEIKCQHKAGVDFRIYYRSGK